MIIDEQQVRDGILEQERHLERLRQWSHLLDQAFRIPGTNIRFGWDVIVGLVPGIGDLSSPLFGVLLLTQAYRSGVPKIVQARMVINALVDALLGVIPILGTAADIVWRANTWNMRLLERHARPGIRPSRFDAVFVWATVATLVLLAIVPVVLGAWLMVWVLTWPH